MAPMSVIEYGLGRQQEMLALARSGVCQAVRFGSVEMPARESLADYLCEYRACFVTLESHEELRGCIGSLEPRRPLGHDLLHNACGAALHDYRFAPLRLDEPIRVSISILSPLEELKFASEAELLQQLKPGEDGLLLQAGRHRATFLPVVWEGLSTPELFVRALKRKAALPSDYWSAQVRGWRYRSEYFSEVEERPACEDTGRSV